MRATTVMFVNCTWFAPTVVPLELPVGLKHLESDFCWCDPIVEVDGDRQEAVVHRQVMWN